MYQLELTVKIMGWGKTRCHRRAEEGDFKPPLKLILGMPALPFFTPSEIESASWQNSVYTYFFFYRKFFVENSWKLKKVNAYLQ